MMGNYPGWQGDAAMGRPITTVAGSWRLVCEANQRRIALILGGAESDTTYYSMIGDDTFQGGIVVRNTAAPLILSRVLHGGLVTRAWFVRGVAGNGTIRVGEAFDDK